MKEEINLNKIEFLHYVEGKLSAQRKAEIDAYLKNNPLEKKALEGAQSINDDFSFSERMEKIEKKIDQRVSEVDQKTTTKITSIKTKSLFRKLAVACSLALIVGIGFFTVFKSQPINESIFVKNFDLYPDALSNITRSNDDLDPILVEAMHNYDQHLFRKAIVGLNKYKDNEKAQFYMAISELGLGHSEKCINILEHIEDMPDAKNLEDGIVWYRALSHINSNEIEKAMPILINISNSTHYKKSQAKEIIKLLQ